VVKRRMNIPVKKAAMMKKTLLQEIQWMMDLNNIFKKN
jgi:hypothetical protein